MWLVETWAARDEATCDMRDDFAGSEWIGSDSRFSIPVRLWLSG